MSQGVVNYKHIIALFNIFSRKLLETFPVVPFAYWFLFSNMFSGVHLKFISHSNIFKLRHSIGNAIPYCPSFSPIYHRGFYFMRLRFLSVNVKIPAGKLLN